MSYQTYNVQYVVTHAHKAPALELRNPDLKYFKYVCQRLGSSTLGTSRGSLLVKKYETPRGYDNFVD